MMQMVMSQTKQNKIVKMVETNDTLNDNKQSEMMAVTLCCLCKKNKGFELECGDNICDLCVKKYILSGIANMKWKKEALVCPECNKGILSDWIVKQCGLGVEMEKKLEQMRKQFKIDNDKTIISCPKCKETYLRESIDLSKKAIINEKKKRI